MVDRERGIRIVCEGISGEIVVNGKKFDSTMPAVVLDDDEVADVLTYIRNSWGNSDAALAPAEVKAARAKTQFPTFPKPPTRQHLRAVADSACGVHFAGSSAHAESWRAHGQ